MKLEHEKIMVEEGIPLSMETNHGILYHFIKHFTADYTWDEFFKWVVDREVEGFTDVEMEACKKFALDTNPNFMPPDTRILSMNIFAFITEYYMKEINELYGYNKVGYYNF